MKDATYYTRLRKRFTLLLFAGGVAPLIIISLSSTQVYRRASMEDTERFVKMAIEDRVDDVELFIHDQKNILRQLVNLYLFENLKDQTQLEKVFASFENSTIVDLGVIDNKGSHVAYVGPYRHKLIDKNYAEAEWFQEVMISGSHISDVFLGYREVPHLIVAVTDPLKQWVLRATINSVYFDRMLRHISLGPAIDAFIINQKGEFQTSISWREFKMLDAWERELILNQNSSEVFTHGKTMYMTQKLKDKQWIMVFKFPTHSFLKSFYMVRNHDLIIILFAVVIIAMVSSLIMHNMVRKIEDVDRKKEELDFQMIQVEKMASLGRLAAGIAHEVNNPLQLIIDQAGWMGELIDEEDRQAVKHYDEYLRSIDKIKFHVRRASSVTHRLLGFSRKMEPGREAVDINALIKECASFLENEANYKNIHIIFNFHEDLPTTLTDASSLQQVILNVLNNSMDAIVKNGMIEVTTSVENNSLKTVIADTGPGIKPEILEKIFDPFFTTKSPDKGTGLGLSICYSTMQQLGGSIKAGNREKGGAEFTIIIPLVKLDDKIK